jgi:hypothetical protein
MVGGEWARKTNQMGQIENKYQDGRPNSIIVIIILNISELTALTEKAKIVRSCRKVRSNYCHF